MAQITSNRLYEEREILHKKTERPQNVFRDSVIMPH